MPPLTETPHVCKEYETLAVPMREIMDADGRFDIYPEVRSKGYFDIDYVEGRLVLKSRGWVGLIPLSDRVTIHVLPRAPIGNLIYMVWRAGLNISGLETFVRGYQEDEERLENPEAVYFGTFLRTLREIHQTGILRRYRERETDRELRGRLLLTKTVSRFRSHGIAHRQVFSVFDHSVDIAENRILKHTAERLANHFRHDTSTHGKETHAELRRLLGLFGHVDCSRVRPEDVARLTQGLVRGLPVTHRFYEPALWLSYLIATKSGVVMEKTGRARFETVLIDVATVFESYVRKLCDDAAATDLGGCRVCDGNKLPVSLFADHTRFPTKPDIYFKRAGIAVALADMKYKPVLKSEDRYEILGFCEALKVDSAAFVCPRFNAEGDVTLHGTTLGGRKIHILTLDLAAKDMRAEEKRFTALLGQTLGLAAPP
jgi:5-methylcytosine-specific restriction enzyme subunit McrC